jgi:hypothetical protein
MPQYGFAFAEDAERWGGQEDTIVAAICEALTRDAAGAGTAVFVCECAAPDINFDGLAEDVVERISEQLYEEVGEVADTFGPFEKSEMSELSALIRDWVGKQGGFSCWQATNIKRYEPGDAEYDAAVVEMERLAVEQREAEAANEENEA